MAQHIICVKIESGAKLHAIYALVQLLSTMHVEHFE